MVSWLDRGLAKGPHLHEGSLKLKAEIVETTLIVSHVHCSLHVFRPLYLNNKGHLILPNLKKPIAVEHVQYKLLMIGVIPCIPQHTVSTKTMYRAKRWHWVCFCVINQYTAWASLKSSDYYWPKPEAVGGP